MSHFPFRADTGRNVRIRWRLGDRERVYIGAVNAAPVQVGDRDPFVIVALSRHLVESGAEVLEVAHEGDPPSPLASPPAFAVQRLAEQHAADLKATAEARRARSVRRTAEDKAEAERARVTETIADYVSKVVE
jgi:hypothetical protein